MSLDKSLKIRGKLARSRNVLTRAERLALMEQRRTWKEGDGIFGLPSSSESRAKEHAVTPRWRGSGRAS